MPYVKLRSQKFQWAVIVLGAIASFVLGYAGFSKYHAALGVKHSILDNIYLALQLFALESGSASGPLPWQLEIARLLAPLIAVWAAVKALAEIFKEHLQLLAVRFFQDHIIICGLGRRGLLLALKYREQGDHVVVIEIDEGNSLINQARSQGVRILIGDATSPSVLRKARIQKARCLIAVCGDDGLNAEVAVHARELMRSVKDKVVTCGVHIVDPKLCRLLREKELESGIFDSFRLEYLNTYESGARYWLMDFPPFRASRSPEEEDVKPHILLVGVGQFGESLMIRMARMWQERSGTLGDKLRVTMIDKSAGLKAESLKLRYPQLAEYCDLTAITMDVESPDFERGDVLFNNSGKCDLTSIFICLDNDSLGLSAALMARQRIKRYSIPIVVRMSHETGLASLLMGETKAEEYEARIYAFASAERTCHPSLILGGVNEELARAIHEEYVRGQKASGQTIESNQALVPWERLPENLKESSRQQAGQIGAKLKAVGCGIERSFEWDSGLFEFGPDEVELLAVMEHDRWVKERVRDGWQKGPKDITTKRSPYIVPWEGLPEETKEIDRDFVRKLPVFLAKAGFKICRTDGSRSNGRLP